MDAQLLHHLSRDKRVVSFIKWERNLLYWISSASEGVGLLHTILKLVKQLWER
jgi:hypothetical protein